jgi:acetylornithine deacetylase
MNALLDATLAHLAALVALDTRNPPRAIDAQRLFDVLRARLPGFDCRLSDHGAGAVSVLAVRGRPRLLFNVHLDTVPDVPGWSADPFALRVDGSRATGLGACDTKGAAAALLAVANASDGDLAILFTSDEEANDARCIAAFLREVPANRYAGVIVAEPTGGEAVLAHRGIASLRLRFDGRAGHASDAAALAESALHHAVRWSTAALEFADAQVHTKFGGLTGQRLNIGRIEGGIKANVTAPSAELRVGLRPLPSMDHAALLATLRELAGPAAVDFEEIFRGPPLPAGDDPESARLAARDLADELGLAIGHAVDFWTEAALFSAAGFTTLVCGPGHIAQAHGADEWVALAELARHAETLHRIVDHGRA